MASILSSSTRPLPVAQSLDAALGLFRASLLTCLPYGVATVLASQLPQLCTRLAPHASVLSPLWWAVNLLAGLLAALFWNATLLRVAAVTSRSAGAQAAPRVRAELPVAARRAPAVLGLVLLLILAGAVLLAPAWLLPTGARLWVMAPAVLILVYLSLILAGAWVPLVLQQQGFLASLAHGVHLLRGNSLRVLTVYIVGALILLVLVAVVSVLIALVAPLVGGNDLAVISSLGAVVLVAGTAAAVPFVSALIFILSAQLTACMQARPAAAPAAPLP